MGLGRRPEVGGVEAAADRGAADADAAHGDEAVAIERAGEGALNAGAQKGGPARVETSEQNRVQLARRRGVVLRNRCTSRRQEGHHGKRRARTSRQYLLPRPAPHGCTTQRQLQLQCSAAPARSARGEDRQKGRLLQSDGKRLSAVKLSCC